MEERKEIMNELAKIYASLPEPVPPKRAMAMKVSNECGCSLTTAYNWLLGKTMPEDGLKIEKLKKIIKQYN